MGAGSSCGTSFSLTLTHHNQPGGEDSTLASRDKKINKPAFTPSPYPHPPKVRQMLFGRTLFLSHPPLSQKQNPDPMVTLPLPLPTCHPWAVGQNLLTPEIEYPSGGTAGPHPISLNISNGFPWGEEPQAGGWGQVCPQSPLDPLWLFAHFFPI